MGNLVNDNITKELTEEIYSILKSENFLPKIDEGNYGNHQIVFGEREYEFQGSKYFCPTESKQFIHYTSFENLINIINEGAFRMYSLQKTNDPIELHYAASKEVMDNYYLKLFFPEHTEPKLPEEGYNLDFRNQLFFLSLFNYLGNSEKHDEEFLQWRLYGRNGAGVGIVVEFDNEHRNDWYHWHLCKMQYEKEKLHEIFDAVIETFKKHNTRFGNFNGWSFLKFLGLHKSEIWKHENEIRFLYQDKQNSDFTPFANIDGKGNLNYFIKKEIENLKKDNFGLSIGIPKITIKKIILGYNYNEEQFQKINQFLNGEKSLNFSAEITPIKEMFSF